MNQANDKMNHPSETSFNTEDYRRGLLNKFDVLLARVKAKRALHEGMVRQCRAHKIPLPENNNHL